MTTAYNRLYEPDVAALPPTHLYVRCLPRTMEEAALLESLPLDWFDMPLDYEIAQMGTYYQDPAVNNPLYTWLYTVIPANYTLPTGIQQETLARLLIAPYRSFLTREAYNLVGAPYNDDWSAAYRIGDCTPECENYPDCLLDANIPCNPQTPQPPGSNPLPTEPPCHPGMPNWPDCLMIPVNEETIAGTPAQPGSLCQCPLNSNPRKPGGRVQVQDTQIGNTGCMAGVRRVKVRIMENMFQWQHVYTDDQGCFKSDNSVSGGLFFKTRIWVIFKNDRAAVRGLRNANLLDYSHPVTDLVGQFSHTDHLNNLQIIYGNSTNNSSKAKMYWAAAHANNAVHEWHDYAAESGIDPPPNGLKILCTPFIGGRGAAPMFHQIFGIGAGVVNYASFGLAITSYIAYLFDIEDTGIQTLGITVNFLTTYFATFAPDVVLGRFDYNYESDDVKELYYHELAHAVHYRKVTDNYWINHIAYTILNMGYGDGSASGAGKVEVAETWAYEMGYYLADKYYGLNHSNTISTSASVINSSRHLYRLEDSQYLMPSTSFIPDGLFRDLVDDNSLNPLGVSENPSVTDNVKDFTHIQLYQALTNEVDNMEAFKTELQNNTPTLAGNTQADYDALFSSYGY